MLYSIIGGVAAVIVIAVIVTVVIVMKKPKTEGFNNYYGGYDESFKMKITPQAPPPPPVPMVLPDPVSPAPQPMAPDGLNPDGSPIAMAPDGFNPDGSPIDPAQMQPAGQPVTSPAPQKENFLMSPQPVRLSPVTGAIVGPAIMTNQMTRTPLSELTNQVNTNGLVSDGAISIGVSVGPGFDKVYQNQLDIQTIDDKAVGGYQQREDLTSISHKIGSNNNNANFNLFSRGGSTPTKLILAPNEVRCVVDEKYIPERDKNHQIATVGTVIPMQGYDVNVERMGEQLLDTHFSTYSSNKAKKRIQTAAGTTTVKESPNAKTVNEEIKTNGEVAVVKDATEGADVAVKLDNQPETFVKYAYY